MFREVWPDETVPDIGELWTRLAGAARAGHTVLPLRTADGRLGYVDETRGNTVWAADTGPDPRPEVLAALSARLGVSPREIAEDCRSPVWVAKWVGAPGAILASG